MPTDKKAAQAEPKQKGIIARGFKAVWRLLQPFRRYANWLILLGFLSAVANGAVPYVTGRFFDALIAISEGRESYSFASFPTWAIFLVAWIVVQIVANNTDWIKDRIERRVETGVRFKLQVDGFVHMFHLPLSYHKNAHTNGDLQKISTASWQVVSIIEQSIKTGPQILSIAIGLALAASINMWLALIMVVGVLIYAALLLKIVRPLVELDKQLHGVWNEGWDDAAASIQQVEGVKQAAGEAYEIQKVQTSLMDRAHGIWLTAQNSWGSIEFFQRTIVFLTQLAIFVVSVSLISHGSITVGQLIALNGYALMFFGPFASLGTSWQFIQNGLTAAAHVEDIFDEKQEIYHPADAVPLGELKGRVTFKDVHFTYSAGQPEVLTGIDLDIQPGQVVAMVGESGVGKSTSVHLISGYYFPTTGSVEVDGIDTRRLDLTELRQQIGVVPQEVALFNDSIMANIRYGTFGASDEAVRAAAAEAHMDGFIATLPEGYDTLVGERGIKLSVGQKQRVAIARAILRDPRILILDEPTSALDAETERVVTGALERLMKGRTTFIIAHRLSTVRSADVILVFQKGRIAERGTHAELIQIPDGIYRKLYEYQIGLH